MFRFAVHVTAVVPLKIAQTAITANSTNRMICLDVHSNYWYRSTDSPGNSPIGIPLTSIPRCYLESFVFFYLSHQKENLLLSDVTNKFFIWLYDDSDKVGDITQVPGAIATLWQRINRCNSKSHKTRAWGQQPITRHSRWLLNDILCYFYPLNEYDDGAENWF